MSDERLFQLVFVLPLILTFIFLGVRGLQMGLDGYFTDTDDYYRRHYPNYNPDEGDTYTIESCPNNEGPFVGSKNSNVYHRPTCSCAENIYDYNEVWFETRANAEDQEYRPCKRCKP